LPGLNYNYGTLTSVPYGFSDSISWIKGKHNVKFGLQFTHKDFSNVAYSNSYSFNLQQTADPQNTGKTGIELASLLLGLPNTTGQSDGTYRETSNNWGFYVQDEWKVRSNLTINLGLRYDTFPLPHFYGRTGLISGWDWKTGEWLIGGSKLPPACDVAKVAPCIPGDGNLSNLPFGDQIRVADDPGGRHPIYDNFGPRPSAGPSLTTTLLQAGYGIYFDTESSTAQEAQNTTSGLSTGVQGLQPGRPSVHDCASGESFIISPVTTGAPGAEHLFLGPKRKTPGSNGTTSISSVRSIRT
jgi:hypothetical protein